jgi:hypothetical protein
MRAFVQHKEVNRVSGVIIYLIRNIGDPMAFKSLKTFIMPEPNIKDNCPLTEGEEVTVYLHKEGGKIRNETCEKKCPKNIQCKIFERMH